MSPLSLSFLGVPEVRSSGRLLSFRDGIFVEALTPKTAAFFLAFLPQFVDPSGSVWLQFATLGLVSVTLNTAVDIAVVLAASRARGFVLGRPTVLRRLRSCAGLATGLSSMARIVSPALIPAFSAAEPGATLSIVGAPAYWSV